MACHNGHNVAVRCITNNEHNLTFWTVVSVGTFTVLGGRDGGREGEMGVGWVVIYREIDRQTKRDKKETERER